MAEVEDKLLDHNFDGIQEYDNPLPPWWVYFFIASIIWGGAYMYYYHIANIGPGSAMEYTLEDQAYKTEFAEALFAAQNIKWDAPDFKPVSDDASISLAKALYVKNCVSCHAKDGGGGIGPNLTDDYWIHGGQFNDIVKTIALGVPEKGMISWKNSLKKDEIIALASFISTMKGTKPANPKPPQGNLEEEGK